MNLCPFTLYLNVENVPNPGRKHFEKTNTGLVHLDVFVCLLFVPWSSQVHVSKP